MDRLVQLFLQNVDPEGVTQGKGPPSAKGIENAIAVTEEMLCSDYAVASGAQPSATFCLLALALEEKPGLTEASKRCYEKTLEKLGAEKGGIWERCVVLQQLGKICVKSQHYAEAERWLMDCVAESEKAKGHPRDASLFAGGFTTQQSKREFLSSVHKLLAKLYLDTKRMEDVQKHYALAQQYAVEMKGDLVEQQLGKAESSAPSAASEITRLWAAQPDEERRLKVYNFSDEGPTVSLILDLNEHLGIGSVASEAISSLRQFKVVCEKEKCDVRLRLTHEGRVLEFRLLLYPLFEEIVPEDTVPKLRGKESKRRLEVKLFKKEKKYSWRDLTNDTEDGRRKLALELAKDAKQKGPVKGTHLNPLSEEELASLPKPGTERDCNRPSGWAEPQPQPTSKPLQPTGSGYAAAQTAAQPQKLEQPPAAISVPATQRPPWVAGVEERTSADGDAVEILVSVSEDCGSVGLQDLELDIDAAAGVQLRLRGSPEDVLRLPVPAKTDATAAGARWRKKIRTLELKFPIV